MDSFEAFGIVFLAAVLHATLQLSLGSLLLLYHASLGKHIRIKTRRLVSNYILGVGMMTGLILATSCFLISVLSGGSLPVVGLLVVAGILVGLAFCAWFLYYRSGRSTELWLPKSVARFINRRAKVTESNVEAFSLGLLVSFAEMPFSLVLMVISGNGILKLTEAWQVVLAMVMYVGVATLPLVILRAYIRHGKTLAEVQKWRTKNKNFFRVLSGVGFLTLAGFLIAFEVMGGGR